MESAMATNITLKRIPADLHKDIKASALRHRRSINSEIIAILEEGLGPRRRTAEDILASARAVREKMNDIWLDDKKIDRAKREGRR
jgi:plasmid stability protein